MLSGCRCNLHFYFHEGGWHHMLMSHLCFCGPSIDIFSPFSVGLLGFFFPISKSSLYMKEINTFFGMWVTNITPQFFHLSYDLLYDVHLPCIGIWFLCHTVYLFYASRFWVRVRLPPLWGFCPFEFTLKSCCEAPSLRFWRQEMVGYRGCWTFPPL